MDKQRYVDYLNETSEKVSPFIQDVLQPYANLDRQLYEGIMFFVERRLHRQMLKPALLRAAYELCGGKEWEKITPACAAFEFINISSYQANATFDNKLGILTKKQQDTQFIAAMSTREVAEDCVRAMRGAFDDSLLARISDCMSISNKYIYIAQHWDINLLTVANADRYENYDYFLAEYAKRCHFGSGVFSGQCAYAGGLLAGASKNELDALKSFGEAFGTALHMINDLGDFIPPVDTGHQIRDYQDYFSDMRNGRLTLPVYLLRQHAALGDSLAQEALAKAKANPSTFEDMRRVILQTAIHLRIVELAKTKVLEAIATVEWARGVPSYGLLRAMLSVVESNKYIGRLRQGTKPLIGRNEQSV